MNAMLDLGGLPTCIQAAIMLTCMMLWHVWNSLSC